MLLENGKSYMAQNGQRIDMYDRDKNGVLLGRIAGTRESRAWYEHHQPPEHLSDMPLAIICEWLEEPT